MVTDGIPTSPNMLIKMVADTRHMVEQRKQEVPLAGVRALASMQRRTFDLSSVIRNDPKLSLIAQIKRTAPDMKMPIENYDPVILAKRFETSGVTALEVATNQTYYRGGIVDLTLVTQNVYVPVIRHDFIYDEYQIVEARAAGADAVMLIAALLDPPHLWDLISITQRNRMTAVVQVQNEEEVRQAIEFEPRVIAISNRDMQTFEVDLDATPRLRPLIPRHIVVISMGAIRTAEDVAHIQQADVDGVVVGQALLTASDTSEAISELFKLTEETMKPYQTLNSKIIFQSLWYKLRQDDIILPNGEQTVYNVIAKGDAVWVVPVLADGRIVLIKQYRYAVDDWCLEIPAGGIYEDATPESTAHQELLEEIGGQAQTMTFIGKYWTMNGIGNEMGHFYLATGVTLGDYHREATEVMEIEIVEPHEALRMARSGEIVDAPSALALLLCENQLI